MALILDTGPLLAFLDRSDKDHVACRALIESATERRIIPAPVLVEVDYWIHARLQPSVLTALLDDIGDGAFAGESITPVDHRRVREVVDQYADVDVGYVDAAVLAVAERLEEPKLATLDHQHFALLRPAHVDALELVPS